MTTIMHLEGGVVVNLGEAKGQYQYLSQEFNRRGLSSHHWSVLTNLYQKAEAATALRARVAELARLVESAYAEGFYRAQQGGVDWDNRPNEWKGSHACAALAKEGA